ncbi:MAG: site-2 protease family protein [Candidatus Aenigmatarchaeota archaeon]
MLDLLIFAAFVAVVAILVIWDRKNIRLEGIVIIRRTKRGVSFLDGVAKKRPRLWKTLSIIGVVVAVPAMIFASWFILNSAASVFMGAGGEGVRLVLPTPATEASAPPGFLLVPWYFWVIGIFSLIIPHEAFHGIISRLEGLRVKNVGWLLLLIIPGAFVEPDEEQLKKAKTSTKLKVYAAGSFANFIMAGVMFMVLMLYVPATMETTGILPRGIEAGLPLANVNASGAILAINGVQMTSVDIMSQLLEQTPPNTIVVVEMTSGNYTIQTAAHELRNGSRVGIVGPYFEYREVKSSLSDMKPVIFFFGSLFDWILLLNLGVGLVNLLPIKPLDGGLFLEAVTQRFTKRSKFIVRTVTIIFLFALLFSIFGGYLMNIAGLVV